MLARLSKWLVILTLMFSLGAHWMLLQSVAWVGMMVSYSQNASFTEAVSKTFDGKHSCCLCKLIRQGKASEKKQELQKPETKIDILLTARVTVSPHAPKFWLMTFAVPGQPSLRVETPPTPPPRLA